MLDYDELERLLDAHSERFGVTPSIAVMSDADLEALMRDIRAALARGKPVRPMEQPDGGLH